VWGVTKRLGGFPSKRSAGRSKPEKTKKIRENVQPQKNKKKMRQNS
jgi:hypothetical protein